MIDPTLNSFIAFAFLVGRFLLVPLGVAVALVIQGLLRRRLLTRLGEPIGELAADPVPAGTWSRVRIALYVFLTAGAIVMGILNELTTAVVTGATATFGWASLLHDRRMIPIVGVYRHGVCSSAGPLYWAAVHSFDDSDGNFELLTKAGMRRSLRLTSGHDDVRAALISAGATQRELR